MPRLTRTCCVLAVLACFHAAAAQIRIVTWNVAELRSLPCAPTALRRVLKVIAADDQPGLATAPAVYAFQEVRSSDVAVLQDLLDATAPAGVSYTPGTYTNNGEDDFGGAEAMFYRADVVTEIPAGHADLYTGAGRFADRWELQVAAGGILYIYDAHLKASFGPDNEMLRLFGATVIRNDAGTLPPGSRIIYAGDMNFSNNAESGYQKFLAPGPAEGVDPLGTGSWAGAAGALEHSQSPRCVSACDLTGGCMDDRFDFELMTAPLVDGPGLTLIPGTCRSFGNDGLHYNVAINDGDNFYYPDDVPRSNNVADSLHDASDHLPVISEFEYVAVPGDLDGDGVVGVGDFLLLLAAWGPCGECRDCPADLDGDCAVGVIDLLELLAGWS